MELKITRGPSRLSPFFSFYGSKHNLAKHYNEPGYETIIEPFAGSACFSLHYYDRKIILYEKDPKIYSVWKFLTDKNVTEEMIHLLSCVDALDLVSKGVDYMDGFDLSEYDFDSIVGKEYAEGARNLVGFWFGRGSTNPRMKPTGWMKQAGVVDHYRGSFWTGRTRIRVASQIKYIKHWKVYNKSYDEIENQEATWFVDPPYSTPAGSSYICNLKKEEYEEVLAPFCMSRNGQVIVCEQQGATWLPFQKFKTIKSTYTKEKKKKESIEVVCYINNKEVVDMNTDIIIEESKNIKEPKKPMSEEQKKKISESVKKRHSEKKLQNISEKTPLQVDKPNCIYLIKDEEDEVHFYSPYVEEAMKFFRFATTIKDPTKKIRLIEVVERVVEEG